jgi:3-carboxy-cis,cis-muconate cycloisomerase
LLNNMSSLIRDLAGGSAEMVEIFGDAAIVKHALAFEAALAEAQAAEGLLSRDEASRIAIACAQLPLDTEVLAIEAAHAGTLAIPLVAHLRRTLGDEALQRKIHLGATSQDVADTALVLQAKDGAALITRELDRLQTALALLAKRMAATSMLGRTLMQSAVPITFGLKVANWLAGIDEAAIRFRRECEEALMLQFGGAAGTRAGLGGNGAAIAGHMAKLLGISNSLLPWQARRGNIAGLAASLAILIGAAAKIARDISLLAQNEIAEVFEPRAVGRGGSSIMAHKRNPIGCQIILSAAARTPGLAATILSALPQEQERGLGGWQAEAPVVADLFILCHGSLKTLAVVIEGLEVDVARMAHNLAAANVGLDVGESEALVKTLLSARKDGA